MTHSHNNYFHCFHRDGHGRPFARAARVCRVLVTTFPKYLHLSDMSEHGAASDYSDTESEVDGEAPGTVILPDAAEQRAISDFCRSERQLASIKSQFVEKRRSVAAPRADAERVLVESLREAPHNCVAIGVETLPKFARLKKAWNLKGINGELIRKAVDMTTVDQVAELMAKKKSPPPTWLAGLLKAVTANLRELRATETQRLELTDTPPKGKRDTDIAAAHREVAAAASAVHKIKAEVRALHAEETEAKRHIVETHANASSVVASFLGRANRPAQRVNINVEGEKRPFYVRAKTSRRKAPITVKEVCSLVENAVARVVDTTDVDEDAVRDILSKKDLVTSAIDQQISSRVATERSIVTLDMAKRRREDRGAAEPQERAAQVSRTE